MSVGLFIGGELSSCYTSNLFNLFSREFVSKIRIESSFQKIKNYSLAVFTSDGDYIKKIVKKNNLTNFGFILDLNKVSIETLDIAFLAKGKFCYFIGQSDDICCDLLNKMSFENFDGINCWMNKVSEDIVVAEYDSLDTIYELIIDGKVELNNILVFYDKKQIVSSSYIDYFKSIGVKLRFIRPVNSVFRSILENSSLVLCPQSSTLILAAQELNVRTYPKIENKNSSIHVDALVDKICSFDVQNDNEKLINIVCFNPTYLFKDLVDRFVRAGCVHSDFPIEGASSYIWMRPQEIWHCEHILQGKDHIEISNTYKNKFLKKAVSKTDFNAIKKKSVAIHHGTCQEPLYQFDYLRLARALGGVKSVVGVCEFEECYGPSHQIANKNNFIFVPIGYDHSLFSEEFFKKGDKTPYSPINIGFVGRAYGTNDKGLLLKSKMAEPKGYRKGGDILLDVLLRLKLLSIDFKIHILGQNWEELTDSLDKYGIDYTYYARDNNISYDEFPRVYSKMDILLITARGEGGPVSAIEALSLGVHVVGTDVGVIKYLGNLYEGTDACNIFNYDQKWKTPDIHKAVEHISNIYTRTVDDEERSEIRKRVSRFTTDNWVESICSYAREI